MHSSKSFYPQARFSSARSSGFVEEVPGIPFTHQVTTYRVCLMDRKSVHCLSAVHAYLYMVLIFARENRLFVLAVRNLSFEPYSYNHPITGV